MHFYLQVTFVYSYCTRMFNVLSQQKPWNAKISFAKNPSRSDVVKYFLCLPSTELYSAIHFKPFLSKHFQQLLGTPEMVFLLTD